MVLPHQDFSVSLCTTALPSGRKSSSWSLWWKLCCPWPAGVAFPWGGVLASLPPQGWAAACLPERPLPGVKQGYALLYPEPWWGMLEPFPSCCANVVCRQWLLLTWVSCGAAGTKNAPLSKHQQNLGCMSKLSVSLVLSRDTAIRYFSPKCGKTYKAIKKTNVKGFYLMTSGNE